MIDMNGQYFLTQLLTKYCRSLMQFDVYVSKRIRSMKIKNKQSAYRENIDDIFQKGSITVECDTSNLLNLQYFFLMKQKRHEFCNLVIDSTLIVKPELSIEEQTKLREKLSADKARISSYLFLIDKLYSDSGTIKFSKEKFINTNLQNMDNVAFGKILPLIPINLETYLFLSMDVEHAFSFCCKGEKNKIQFETTTINKKTYFKENSYKKQNIVNDSLIRICSYYLFNPGNNPKLPIELIKSRIALFTSPDFFEKIAGLSVLAFLIFCAYDKTVAQEIFNKIKPRRQKQGKYTVDEISEIQPDNFAIETAIMNASDMADGILQLAENIVFHAGDRKQNGVGFLSFRIHSNSDSIEDNTYLKSYFPYYFQGHDDRIPINSKNDEKSSLAIDNYFMENPPKKVEDIEKHFANRKMIENRRSEREKVAYYFEMRLMDCSGKNICDVFKQNISERGYTNAASFENITIRAFFSPIEAELDAWIKYSSTSENAVHHYGLQLFDALVQSSDGCIIAHSGEGNPSKKSNTYATSGDKTIKEGSSSYFPGTQYIILLPFKKQERQKHSFVNTNVNFTLSRSVKDYVIYSKGNNEYILSYIDKLNSGLSITSQAEKESFIEKLSEKLNDLNLDQAICLIDACDLTITNMEFFAKSLMMYIGKNQNKTLNFAINNCTRQHFIQIARLFAVFYDRTGRSKFMQDVQIYLSGTNSKDEFLLSGANLRSTLVAQTKLSAARGTSSYITSLLISMLEKRPGINEKNTISFVPFDLLVKDNNGFSVFERNVQEVLNANIQDATPGCKINPNHMRIGSKIHIDCFYEAEVLFYNNYYTSRFAYLLQQQLGIVINLNKKILFIGYETYSEMLIRELTKFYPDANYCIFEYGKDDMFGNSSSDEFRHKEKIQKGKYQLVYVVPINSTLSTFNKLEASFKEKFHETKELTFIKSVYLGVIQIRDANLSNERTVIEQTFFAKISLKDHFIVSRLLKKGKKYQRVYYISIEHAKWEDPLKCKQCFPDKYFKEKPLIETDKSSVVPSQMFGLKNVTTFSGCKNNYVHQGAISSLKGFVKYGHRQRGSNHFQFYVETEKYFNDITNNGDITKWLKEVQKQINTRSTLDLCYDIIVCPIHFSNTLFVKAVNDQVFGGASLVICIDVNKEFRDNFLAKHSDIKNIYDNLKNELRTAEINFHFVDDTIVHGHSIERVRSLVRSLFPKDISQLIKINTFKSIIVLLNRHSNDSVLNYIPDLIDYHYYINLNISSLSTHDDACILCNESNNQSLLSKYSSLNILSSHFFREYKDLKVHPINYNENMNDESHMNKYFLRMRCIHELNMAFDKLDSGKNNTALVFNELIKTILTGINIIKSDEKLDLLISYFEVASNPFISFRKSNREAIFELLLFLFEAVISNFKPQVLSDIENFVLINEYNLELDILNQKKIGLSEFLKLARVYTVGTRKEILLKALIKQSVSLSSNFIIRKDNIFHIILYAYRLDSNLATTKVLDYYLAAVKKLITLGSDKSKSMYLEYLLLFGNEFTDLPLNNLLSVKSNEFGLNFLQNAPLTYQNALKKEQKYKIHLKNFIQNLYLENTKVLLDASEDLNRGKNLDGDDQYYFDYFKRLLKWNHEKYTVMGPALIDVMKALNDDNSNNIQLYYDDLAGKIAQLISFAQCMNLAAQNISDGLASVNIKTESIIEPSLYFLSERKEETLNWDEGSSSGMVCSTSNTVLDCFASNDAEYKTENSEKIRDLLTNVMKINTEEDVIASTYTFKTFTNYSLHVIKIVNNELEAENEVTMPIYLIIKYTSELTEYQRMKSLRYVLMFRSKIWARVSSDFNNNLLQTTLKDIEMQKQIRKVKSNYHGGDFNKYYPEFRARQHFFIAKDDDDDTDDYSYNFESATYGFFINTVIGRVNIKLLSNSDFNMKTSEQPYHDMPESLSSIIHFPEFINFTIYDADENPIERDEDIKVFFMKLLPKNSQYRSNHNGELPYKIYIVAFISELINSAACYAKSNEFDKVRVIIEIDSSGYMWICNEVNPEFTVDVIKSGLLRQGSGISLATICGYFDAFYKLETENRVRILFNPKTKILKIGIPLLVVKESDTHEMLPN